ncbi:hypothetical protein [Vibrio owensii]|uniref:hypothetical protein n=1 Tax=Vibrio owensii TaxID=696485 RepID=UPI0018F269A0|nr:hypothetical protein [Vibrio owensii]
MSRLKKLFFTNSVKIGMLEDMHELLSEGMPVVEIAEDFKQYGSGAVSAIGEKMLEVIDLGQPVSTAFEGYMNEITVQTLLAGEVSQDLRGGCVNAIQSIRNTGGVIGLILKSVAFPVIQLFLITSAVVVLSKNIFPILEGLIPIYLWPSISKSFYDFVLFMSDNSLIIIATLIVSPYLMREFLARYVGPGRAEMDQLPGFAQFRYVVSAQVMYTMSIILRSGGSMVEAIKFAKKGVPRYQQSKIDLIDEKLGLSRSASLGEIMDVDLLDARQLDRLKVMASSGSGNAERLERCATAHSLIIESQVSIMARILKALVMAVAFLMLLGLLGAIMLLVMQARSAIV